jgi:tetratricopeptide (TPR) repeat protein
MGIINYKKRSLSTSIFRFRIGLSSLAVLVCLVLFIGGCANEKAARLRLNSGIAYLESRNYPLALKELLEAEKQDSSNPLIHYYLGILYHVKGLPNDSIREFEKAIDLKSDYSEAYNYLGLVYDSTGQFDNAIASYKKALSNLLYETPSFAWNNLGWSYYKKGDYDAAVSAFSEAIKLEPNLYSHAVFEINIGRSFLAKKEYDRAILHFNKVLQTAPDFIEARYWLGKCFEGQNKKYAALKEYQAVIAKVPNTELAIKAKAEIDQLTKPIRVKNSQSR